MKFLSIILLIAISAIANTNISNFSGKTYLIEDMNLCLSDYDMIQKNMNQINEFTILDGGCVEHGTKHVRLEFNYMHPLTKRIEKFKTEFADNKTCEMNLTRAMNELQTSGNIFITSMCKMSELNLHYVDTTYSVSKTIRNLGKFNSKNACMNFLNTLEKKAQAINAYSLLSSCREVKYGFSGVSFYMPVFNYISYYEINIELIKGKSSLANGACLANEININRNFSNNNIKIVHTYCSDITTDNTQQENILYLKPSFPQYITEFKGVILNEATVCENQLDNIVRSFNASGNGVLYSQCVKLGEKRYRALVNYVKILEL